MTRPPLTTAEREAIEEERDRDVSTARHNMRVGLEEANYLVGMLRENAVLLGDGPGNLYDVEWAEGPGARLVPAALDRIATDLYIIKSALAEGQGATA